MGGEKLGRITTNGEISLFNISCQALDITAGPDGNLWFTEYNKLGQMSTNGVKTEFPIPDLEENTYLNTITAGPDGNIWFTEEGAGGYKIGKITTNGSVTEFPSQ